MKNQSQQQRVQEKVEVLEQKVKTFQDSDVYKDWLRTTSKFYNYSLNNTIMILTQTSGQASYVAGFRTWETKFDRHVNAGAKGIQILQPAPYKNKVEVEKIDADGKVIYKDGIPEMETVEKIIPSYKIGYVFDVADTSGAPLPEIVKMLDSQVKDFETIKTALQKISPVPIVYEDFNGMANGYYSNTLKEIHVKKSMGELQQIKTTLHELAHAYMHDDERGTDVAASKQEREIEAESVAFIVCEHLGFDTAEYSFGYINSWSDNKEIKEMREKLTQIKDTAGEIINKLDDYFMTLQIEADNEIAYKNGEGYYLIYRSGDGYHFNVYDTNYHLVHEQRDNRNHVSLLSFRDEVLAKAGINQEYLSPYNTKYLREQVELISQMQSECEIISYEKASHSIAEHSFQKTRIK